MTEQQTSGNFGDYLQALAFRVLHEDGVLQPRRASLFEAEPAQIEAYEESEQFKISELIRPQSVAPIELAPTESRAALPAPAAPITPAPGAIPAKPQAQRAMEEEARIATRPPRALQSAIDTAVPEPKSPTQPSAPLMRSETPAAQLVRATLAQRLEAKPIAAPTRSAPAAIATELTMPAPASTAHHEPHEEPRAPQLTSSSTRTQSPTPATYRRDRHTLITSLPQRLAHAPQQAIMIARPLAAAQTLSPLPMSAARASREETSVEITIGRLEIRALSAPAAAPQKTQARRPEETLKDYLRRKSGGHA